MVETDNSLKSTATSSKTAPANTPGATVLSRVRERGTRERGKERMRQRKRECAWRQGLILLEDGHGITIESADNVQFEEDGGKQSTRHKVHHKSRLSAVEERKEGERTKWYRKNNVIERKRVRVSRS